MYRRDLLKGLVALPLSYCVRNTAGLLAMDNCQPARFESLKVVLAGPFAVVLQVAANQQVQKVFAFTPMAYNGEHFFSVNSSKPDNSKAIALTLPPTGLVSTGGQLPYIDPDFASFNVKEKAANINSNSPFVFIDLPCPDRIIYTFSPAKVHFKSNPTQAANMPLNHILIYQVDHSQGQNPPIKMTSSQLGDVCLDRDSDTFLIEVGRDPNSGSGTTHEVKFFNEKLLPCFPGVQNEELNDIAFFNDIVLLKEKKQKKQQKEEKHKYVPFTQTLECKNGGLIVTAS